MALLSVAQSWLKSIDPFLPWAVAFLLIVSVVPSYARIHKYFELCSHFRVQYCLASFVVSVACVLLADWWCMAAALIAVAINLIEIVPFYLPKPSPNTTRETSHRIKLALINVNHANQEYSRFIAWSGKQPLDVLVVQEVNQRWSEALTEIAQQFPFSEVVPLEKGSGLALYSRFPIHKLHVVLSEGDARPPISVRLDVGKVKVFLFSFHPRAPIRKGHFELRNNMLASAADYVQELPHPKICVGDFNISPWSRFYRDFVKQTRLIDVRKGFGLLPTWPTFLLFRWLMIPIDHCLVSDDIGVAQVTTGEQTGSDHLPLVVDLELGP